MSIDKWIFVIGILCLTIFFFIRKKKKKISKVLLVVGLLILFAPLYLPRKIFGKWDSIKNLKGKIVNRILLQPSLPDWDVNLTEASLNIDSRNQIDNITALLKETEIYYPNHPKRIWESKIILITNENDSLILRVEKTENNGTIIYSNENRFRKDKLAEYLESITNFTKPLKVKK